MMKSFLIIFLLMPALLLFSTIPGGRKIKSDNHSMRQAKKKTCDSSRTALLFTQQKTNIYLTIDDGPSAASFYLSNIAMADSIYLTMFVIGDSVFQNRSNTIFYDLYQLNPFIETGNHSYSHANGHYHQYYLNAGLVTEDFCKNQDSLQIKNKIARLPGRNTWRIDGRKRSDLPDDAASADSLVLKGYRIFGWDIEWKYKQDSSHNIESAGKIINAINSMNEKKNSFTPDNIVILCHESMFIEPDNRLQFESLVKSIRQNPLYRMMTLSHYPTEENHILN